MRYPRVEDATWPPLRTGLTEAELFRAYGVRRSPPEPEP